MNIDRINYHLAFGDSAAGSLRFYFSNLKKEEEKKIIGIIEDFSCGPLKDYETEEGELRRINWINELLDRTHQDEDTRRYFRESIGQLKRAFKDIKEDEPIVIWYADNILDNIGLRHLTSVLQNKGNNIYTINASESPQKARNSKVYIPRSLAEVPPENFDLLVPSCKLIDKLQWAGLKKDWVDIKNDNHTLRIWKDGKVIFVDDTYYDSLIIKNCKLRYANCARVIGRVMGESKQIVSELLIDWRMRILLDLNQ